MKTINSIFLSIFYSILLSVGLFVIATLFGRMARADVFNLEEVSVSFKNYINGRNPLITNNGLDGAKLGQELSLNLNTSIYDIFYWENNVHTTTDKYTTHNGQFRLVGYQFRLGARLTENLDLGFYHHSQHLLDHVYPYGGFPYEGAFEIKLYLNGRPKGQSSLTW